MASIALETTEFVVSEISGESNSNRVAGYVENWSGVPDPASNMVPAMYAASASFNPKSEHRSSETSNSIQETRTHQLDVQSHISQSNSDPLRF